MTVKEWIKETNNGKAYQVRGHAECQDGFTISIQASGGHYCTPIKSGLDYYDSLELGFPSEEEPLLEAYKEGDIYPYVPIDLAEEVVAQHGGIRERWRKQKR